MGAGSKEPPCLVDTARAGLVTNMSNNQLAVAKNFNSYFQASASILGDIWCGDGAMLPVRHGYGAAVHSKG